MNGRWLSLMLILVVGCDTSTSKSFFHSAWDAPPAPPAQVHTTWENQMIVTQDVVNNGAPLAGLAGRLYLFGTEVGHPLQWAGAVTVQIHDVTPGREPKFMEEFKIDPETLKRLARKDTIGWGYTLFLPLATHRPDIQRVQVQTRFEMGKSQLFAPPAVVSLRSDPPAVASQAR